MTRLYLIRHGEVDNRGAFYGQTDVPLSPAGLRQMTEAAQQLSSLGLRAVYSSDLQRAQDGARLIATAHGLDPRPLPGLREMHLGRLEGVPFDEGRRSLPELTGRTYRDMWSYRFPDGGENLQDLMDRLGPVLDDLLREHPRGTVAMVAHNTINRLLLGQALGLPLRYVFDFVQDYGCINRIDYSPGEQPRQPDAIPLPAGWQARVVLMNWTPQAPSGALHQDTTSEP